MPDEFAINGTKNSFSSEKIQNGFSANLEDILQGDNLNYVLDSVSQQLKYLNTVVDYLNSIGVKKVPYINADNKLDYTDINGLLPSQADNNGKFLATNGTVCSWSNNFLIIGEPRITLNFNYILPSNCVWLDGTAGENNDGVVPTTGDWADLFAIYGWTYDSSYTDTNYFKLPNFTNKAIWGGTTAGYIEAGLPNIVGHFHGVGQFSFDEPNNAFYKIGSGTQVSNEGAKDNNYGFNASRCSSIYGKSSTVQPPSIKVRVYTRYK